MAFGVTENGFGGIVEHLAPLTETKYLLPRRLAVAAGGGALIAALLFLAFRFSAYLMIFLALTVGAGFLVWFLWRYTQVEYEYLIAEGEMSFSVIYGKRSRRDVFSFNIKEAERVVRYGEEKAACDAFPADRTRFYASRLKEADTLCALITREDGQKVRLFFQGTPEAVAALRRANPRAVQITEVKSAPEAEAQK